jgi:hypothetical protein
MKPKKELRRGAGMFEALMDGSNYHYVLFAVVPSMRSALICLYLIAPTSSELFETNIPAMSA